MYLRGRPSDGSDGAASNPLWVFGAILLRHRLLLLGLPLALALVVGLFTMLAPRKYKAAASFIPQEPSATPSSVGQLAAQFGLATPRTATGSPQFYADLLGTKELLRQVALTDYTSPGHNGNLITYYKNQNEPRNEAVLKTIRKLQEAKSVEANRITGVVRLEVVTQDPQLSAQIVRRMLGLLNDYNLSRRQSQARAEREFVEGRLREAQTDLTRAEKALADFHAANRIVSSPYLQAREEQLQRQVVLRQELFTTLSANFEAARIDEVRSTPVVTVIEPPEGFVEPVRRYAIRKTLIALIAGFGIATLLAFLLEYVRRARQAGGSEFDEFADAWNQARTALNPIRVFRRG